MNEPLLDAQSVHRLRDRRRFAHAVEDVSLRTRARSWAGGRERLRQDDPGVGADASAPRQWTHHPLARSTFAAAICSI
ncbi:MAG: hypothetical protein R2856_35080 [Caldilineaceae bacterium]